MSFTPGPWRVTESTTHSGFAIVGNVPSDGKSDQVPLGPQYIADVHWRYAADARLIAAAPELLDVAKAALAIHTDECEDADGSACSLNRALRAVIAKAEGRDVPTQA